MRELSHQNSLLPRRKMKLIVSTKICWGRLISFLFECKDCLCYWYRCSTSLHSLWVLWLRTGRDLANPSTRYLAKRTNWSVRTSGKWWTVRVVFCFNAWTLCIIEYLITKTICDSMNSLIDQLCNRETWK